MNTHFARNGDNHFDVLTVLERIPNFKDLTRSELQEFARIIYVRWYRKNETIFYEGESGIGMYIIYQGSVKIFKKSELNGREQITIFTRGEFLGELSLLQEQPRPFTAITLEDCCLLGIFRPELIRLADRKPRLGNKIFLILNQLITKRLHNKNEELRQIKDSLSNSDIIL